MGQDYSHTPASDRLSETSVATTVQYDSGGDWNLQGWKMTDWKMTDWNLADYNGDDAVNEN